MRVNKAELPWACARRGAGGCPGKE